MTGTFPDRISLMPNVIFQQVNDEAVLLDMVTEQYYALNELGMRVWQLLTEGMTLKTAIVRLLEEYEVDEVTLYQDVSNWIAELASLGLVTIDDDIH